MVVIADGILRHWFTSLIFQSKVVRACFLAAMLFTVKSEGFFPLGLLRNLGLNGTSKYHLGKLSLLTTGSYLSNILKTLMYSGAHISGWCHLSRLNRPRPLTFCFKVYFLTPLPFME